MFSVLMFWSCTLPLLLASTLTKLRLAWRILGTGAQPGLFNTGLALCLATSGQQGSKAA